MFEIFKDYFGRYRWRLLDEDGQLVLSSPGVFIRKRDAQRDIARAKRAAAGEVVDLVDPKASASGDDDTTAADVDEAADAGDKG